MRLRAALLWLLLLPACGADEQQPQEPSAPTPEPELGVPEDYEGPIDPEWPPSHAADLEVQLRATAILDEREREGREATTAHGESLIEGHHPGVRARTGRVGDFDYIEVTIGHVTSSQQELPLVVLLHGRGDRPRIPGAGIGQEFPVRIFIPRAPDELGEGYTWLATWSRSDNQELLARSIAGRVDELAPAIEAFRELRPTRGRPILVGFSQGGIMTYALATRYPDRYRAAFPIAGWLPPSLRPTAIDPGIEYPIIHAMHGDADETVPFAYGQETASALRALGLHVGFTAIPGVDHRVTPEMGQQVRDWIRDAAFPKRASDEHLHAPATPAGE